MRDRNVIPPEVSQPGSFVTVRCRAALTIDFQIINFTRPEGGDNTSSISPTDNAVKLLMWKSILTPFRFELRFLYGDEPAQVRFGLNLKIASALWLNYPATHTNHEVHEEHEELKYLFLQEMTNILHRRRASRQVMHKPDCAVADSDLICAVFLAQVALANDDLIHRNV
jgi:hypothetical protein